MKVLMITTTYPRFEGDTAGPFIASIAEGIAELGHAVDVVLPFHPKLRAGTRNGVRLHPYHVPGDRWQPTWGYAQSMDADVKLKKRAVALAPVAMHNCYRSARALASRSLPDLIHAHWVLPNGYVGMKLATKLKLPLVVSLHGSDMFLARKNPVFRGFASAVLKIAGAVTACSPDLQEQAAQLRGKDVALTEYGVDIRQFRPDAEIPREARGVFSVGRLVHKKGFQQLIDAFDTVHKYYPDSTLTIAGDGPLFSALKEQAEKLASSQSIRFPGNIDRIHLPEFFQRAGVVAVPSITDAFGNRDGLPNVMLEALSSGCAVVASDIPGISNLVTDRSEALIVPSGDVEQLANGIKLLFEDAELRDSLRIRARAKAEENLAWQVKSKQLESIYESLL